MKTEALKIAMISMHSSPLGELGTRDTGGMSIYIREVARRLSARGHSIDIFTRVQRPVEIGANGAKIVELFENVRLVHLRAGPPGPLPYSSLHGCIEEFFEGLEHFRNTEGIGYDLVHSHYCLSGQIGRWARSRWHVPHVFMFHTLGVLKNRVSGSSQEPALRIAAERSLAAECDLLLAATEREKRHLVELYAAAPEKIHVTPCGVDLEKFRPAGQDESRARLKLCGAGPVILYVGRFDPVKGVDRLLAAAAGLRSEFDPHVVLVGGGSENAPEGMRLRTLCAELSLTDCVTFVGCKAHDELPDYYRAADVLVLPSHYESFGLVVLEALACGTPVVAMRVGVVEDVVRSGTNGWVVPDNSPARLAEGIRLALGLKASGRASADSIRATVVDYDWSFVARSIDGDYKLLLTDWAVEEDQDDRFRGCSGGGGASR